MSNRDDISSRLQVNQPQAIDTKRKRLKIEPQVPSIRAGIFGAWLNGAADSVLADRYGCGESFIRSVCRAEARKQREQLYMLRSGVIREAA